MSGFFVFSHVTKEVREGTGLVGFRDKYTYDTRDEAEVRRLELKNGAPVFARPTVPIRGHVVREEK